MEPRPNPNAGMFELPEGYTDLGFQNGWATIPPQVVECHRQLHENWTTDPHTREFDNSMFQNRGTDVITICDTCKIVYHTDMSD